MKTRFLILLILPLVFFGCREDFDNTFVDTTYQPPKVIVTANLTGQVVGPNGIGEPNVMVRVSNEVAITDENGFYQFRDAALDARGTYVTASKSGFFHGSDRLYPANGSNNFSTIELLPKTVTGTITGSVGGTVEVAGAKVIFPANAIRDAQYNRVDGEVRVVAHWLNPVADNIQDIMPGGLFGLNKDGGEVMMASMGMLAVELQDAQGNELQIATGKTATLSMPVPAELLANAPAEVPLWYFDESLGLWLEEGVAKLEGGAYVGEVSHFTFWNVDVPTGVELIFISGCIVTPDGNGVPNKDIRIIAPSNSYIYAYGVTDDSGHFSGYLPAGDLLTFEIYDDCDEISSFDVGPFNIDTELDCFEISTTTLVTVSGQIVSCDNMGVAQALIVADWNGGRQTAFTDDNGDFSMMLFNCEDTNLTIYAIDFFNLQQTEEVSLLLTENEDLGVLQACDNLVTDYLTTTDMNGEDITFYFTYLNNEGYIDSLSMVNYKRIESIRVDGAGLFHISLISLEPGIYSGSDIGLRYFVYDEMPNNFLGSLYCEIPCEDMTVVITSNTGPGGFMKGTFSGVMSGSVSGQSIVDLPMSGDFRVSIPE